MQPTAAPAKSTGVRQERCGCLSPPLSPWHLCRDFSTAMGRKIICRGIYAANSMGFSIGPGFLGVHGFQSGNGHGATEGEQSKESESLKKVV